MKLNEKQLIELNKKCEYLESLGYFVSLENTCRAAVGIVDKKGVITHFYLENIVLQGLDETIYFTDYKEFVKALDTFIAKAGEEHEN